MDVKEDLFCEEELATVVKELKNNKTLVADAMVNEFLTHGGSEVRNKSLIITNIILKNGKYLAILRNPNKTTVQERS